MGRDESAFSSAVGSLACWNLYTSEPYDSLVCICPFAAYYFVHILMFFFVCIFNTEDLLF